MMNSYESMEGQEFTLFFDNNVKKYKSLDFPTWYSIKTNLVDRFPDCLLYVVPTALKGIGKSYSTWDKILIPLINSGQTVLNIRWTEDELDLMVDEFKSKPETLQDKINFTTHWKKTKKLYSLVNSETGKTVVYFASPSAFKIIKGLASREEADITDGAWYWDEFLLPNRGDYREAQTKIDSLWQVLGSLFRNKKWIGIMSANIINPDNPWMDYMFKDIGWPQPGEVIVDHTRGIVLESPKWNKFLQNKYEDTPLYRITKGTHIHRQLFGGTNLNDSIYDNQDMIIYRLEEPVRFYTNFRLGVKDYTVVSFNNDSLVYITDQKCNIEIKYAANLITHYETKLELIDESILWWLRELIINKQVRFKSVSVMNEIILLISRLRISHEVIDWSKKE